MPKTGGRDRKNHLLVIGIDKYDNRRDWPELRNAEHDAEAFAKLMVEKYQFEAQPQNLLLGKTATREEILEKFESFTGSGKNALTMQDNLVVYFAGHGEIRGTRGYWVPREGRHTLGSLVSHDDIYGLLGDIHAHHIYIIADACFAGDFVKRSSVRENPFADNADAFPSRRVLASGRSGQTVSDGVAGQHSPFARALLTFLNNSIEPVLPAEKLELHVKDTVPRLVKGQQPISAFLQDLNDQQGQFVFRKKVLADQAIAPKQDSGQEQTPAKEAGELRAYIPQEKQLEKEELEWRVAEKMDTVEAYGHYLSLFPEGKYSGLAGNRINKRAEKAWRETPKNDSGFRMFMEKFPFPALPSYKAAEKALASRAYRSWLALQQQKSPKGLREYISNYPESIYVKDAMMELEKEEQVIFETAKRTNTPETYIKAFSLEAYAKRSGFFLPETILIKGGTFKMGSNEAANEKPIHTVEVNDFYLGTYPITFEEYDAYCEIVNIEKPVDGGWGRGKLPVINVSWEEAQAYCEWLQTQTGLGWRLPTESEWEYAAGGGYESRTNWSGTNSETNVGKYVWYNANSGGKIHPVGQKLPNGLGLYDMCGNVWEWCGDWYTRYSPESRINPMGPDLGQGRVIRGGSWKIDAARCRVSNRDYIPPSNRYHDLGFRLARSL